MRERDRQRQRDRDRDREREKERELPALGVMRARNSASWALVQIPTATMIVTHICAAKRLWRSVEHTLLEPLKAGVQPE